MYLIDIGQKIIINRITANHGMTMRDVLELLDAEMISAEDSPNVKIGDNLFYYEDLELVYIPNSVYSADNHSFWERYNYDRRECESIAISWDDDDMSEKIRALDYLLNGEDEDDEGSWDEEGYMYSRPTLGGKEAICIRPAELKWAAKIQEE